MDDIIALVSWTVKRFQVKPHILLCRERTTEWSFNTARGCEQGGKRREIPTREWEVQAVVQASPVDIITVMLGGNDLLQNEAFTAGDVTVRMESFLRALKTSTQGVRLLLIAPPPMQPGAWVYEERLLTESVRLGVCYRALAETLGVDFADAGMWDISARIKPEWEVLPKLFV